MISGNFNQSELRILYLITINYKTVIKRWLRVLYNRPQEVRRVHANACHLKSDYFGLKHGLFVSRMLLFIVLDKTWYITKHLFTEPSGL